MGGATVYPEEAMNSEMLRHVRREIKLDEHALFVKLFRVAFGSTILNRITHDLVFPEVKCRNACYERRDERRINKERLR